MKTMKFKNYLLSIILLIVSFSIYSIGDATKNIHKEYSVKNGYNMMVENKFGDIDIYNWDKDQITIDVTILVEHINDEKAQHLLDYINVEFYESDNEIKAITTFNEGFDKITNSIFTVGSKEFSIDYKINMPDYMNIIISNKYGNMFVSKVSGLTRLNMKYGNIKIIEMLNEKQEPMNKVELGYGNITIDKCTWLKVDIKYSNADIDNSNNLDINSKYSKLNIGNTESCTIDSKYDTYNFKKVSRLQIETEYSKYKIGQLDKKFIVESKYTNFNVNSVDQNFENISIENQYGSIKLNIDENASYKIEGEAKYCKIFYPDNSSVSRIIENTEMQVNGIVGDNKNTTSKVKIDTKYGHVYLNE